MKLPLIATCLVAGSTWSIAFAGDATVLNPKTATTPFSTARGTLIPLAPPGNDDCSAATVVVGNGPHAFTNVGATTGPQQGLSCGTGICHNDVWYSWVGTTSGQIQLTLCNGGAAYDSLIAVYAGSTCPAPGSALACNDDSCALVSQLTFSATSGSSYMVQIGAWAAGGSGSGTFQFAPAPQPPPCADYDDGSTDNLLGWTAGGDMVWLSRFGSPGVQTTILSLDVVWFGVANGSPTNVFLWQDDPTQDGLPGTSALLLNIPTVVSLSGTDTYVNYPIPPLTITGIFFVGTRAEHQPGQFVAPLDTTNHPYSNVSFFFGVNVPGQFANYANPGANVQPPLSFDQIGYPAQVLVRVDCANAPTYLCDPGSSPTLACPCANPPSGAGRGCNNSSNTGGASISGAGLASVAASTLVFTTAGEKPTALSIVLQGSSVNTTGFVFGQGIRCATGLLKRLYTHNAVGGSISAPSGTDLDIPTRSANLGDPIAAGQSRLYMVFYRDATVLGGCPAGSTFNDTNTAAILWAP
jgi:hypothetical protein